MDRHGVFDLDLVRDRGPAITDQGHIRRRPAHVIADQVRPAGAPPGVGGGDHTRCRARHHRLRSFLDDTARRHGAAIAVHHQQLAAIAAICKFGGKTFHIPLQQRLHRGIHRSGHAALELAAFGQQPVPHGDIAVRPDVGQHLGGPYFMVGVGIGMQKMDHHRLRAPGQKRGTGSANRILVERGDDTAGIVHPFRHLDTQVTRDDGLEMSLHAIGLRPCAAPELEDITKTGSGDQAGAAELALQHGIGRGRRAMDDKCHTRQVAFSLGDGVHHAECLVVQRAGDLGKAHRAARLVEPDQVGEGAAYINTDQITVKPVVLATHS